MEAPVVLAKDYDEVAQRNKAVAAERDIPMVENIEPARALAREVEVGKHITANGSRRIMEILAAVYRLR